MRSSERPRSQLPLPDADALAVSQALLDRIAAELSANGNWISFARYMELVLHEPGLGYYAGGARKLGAGARFHEIRAVVSNLGVFDFRTADRRMRLASLHPGVEVEQVVAGTGFELEIAPDVPRTRMPTPEELRLIRERIDPEGLREREVKG